MSQIVYSSYEKREMRYLNQEIENELKKLGADFVHFVDVSQVTYQQNRGLPVAILIGIAINPRFIRQVFEDPNYLHTLEDEYAQTENRAGEATDELAKFLTDKGYRAISQSDAALLAEGLFNFEKKESILPHKTVALFSGSGWIGKHNLFITPQYGAAQCLGTVLTDAPLEVIQHEPRLPKCGKCNICGDVCEMKVLKGKIWNAKVSRDEIVDVYKCSTCLKCLVHCSWTQKYRKKDKV